MKIVLKKPGFSIQCPLDIARLAASIKGVEVAIDSAVAISRVFYYKTRKSNPFHGFLNGLIPVCLQCVPALNISPLKNFTATQLNNMHYYLYAGG